MLAADLTSPGHITNYGYDAFNRMTNIVIPNANIAYAYDSLSRRKSVTRSNGTRTDYAYETDSDLDWMRDVFAGGATATAPNQNWMGIARRMHSAFGMHHPSASL